MSWSSSAERRWWRGHGELRALGAADEEDRVARRLVRPEAFDAAPPSGDDAPTAGRDAVEDELALRDRRVVGDRSHRRDPARRVGLEVRRTHPDGGNGRRYHAAAH